MKSIFLLCSVLGAVSDASECQADENALLQARLDVRKTKAMESKDSAAILKSMRDVANSLLEGSDSTMDADEVNDALQRANDALAELSPAIRQQVENAQQQIIDATAAVEACHGQAELMATLREAMGQRAAAVESCQSTLSELSAAETQQCGIAEDCLCDEARVRTQDQEVLCESMTATYESAFCDHDHVCNILRDCHAEEAAVYRSLRSDVEAEMEVIRQEYVAAEQSRCLTNLIMEAMTPPRTPISHAALIACDNVDVTGLSIDFPGLPADPDACPAHAHGDPECVSIGVPNGTPPPVRPPNQSGPPGSINYIGCFVDDPSRDLGAMRGTTGDATSNTFALCRQRCEGHRYMSLQYGGECFCANAYATAPQYRQVADSFCNAQNEPCRSNSYNCGGTWHQAIYDLSRG